MADSQKIKRIYELNAHRKDAPNFTEILNNIGNESVHNAFHHEVSAFAELQN